MVTRSCALACALVPTIATMVACASAPQPQAPPPPTGNAWEAHLGTEERDVRAFDDLPPQGMRPLDVTGWSLGGRSRYASLWMFADVHGWEVGRDLDGNALAQNDAKYAQAGMHLIRLDGFDVEGAPRFVAMWELGDPTDRVWKIGLDEEAFVVEDKSQSDRKWQLVDLSTYVDGEAQRFAAIWAPGDPSGTFTTTPHLDWSAEGLAASLSAASAGGDRAVAIDVAVIEGSPHFTVLTTNAPGPMWMAHCGMSPDDWQRQLEDGMAIGYRPARLTGYTIYDQPFFCGIWTQ